MPTSCHNLCLKGIGISSGVARGNAYLYHDILEAEVTVPPVVASQVEAECARLDAAVQQALADLAVTATHAAKQMEAGLSGIFQVHQEILRDPVLGGELKAEIAERLAGAECAVQTVFHRRELRFLALKDPMYRLRANDVADLGRRLLRILSGVQRHALESMPEGQVLVARRLLPSDTVLLPRRSAVAIVVEKGGPGSHCALLARAMGLPAVANIPGLFEAILPGDDLLVDWLRGVVTVRPGAAALDEFRVAAHRQTVTVSAAKSHAQAPATTLDRVTIPVLANVAGSNDVQMAADYGADGIGLYRIEMYYLARRTLPEEEELFEHLHQSLESFHDKFVCVRLLDVGGDKALPFLPPSPEPNPSLGRRGIRLLLDCPALLRTQARVLVRLAQEHRLHVLIPMVTFAEDVRRVQDVLNEAAADLGCSRLPRLGAMIETPAAAICADEIVEQVDFLSLGTNDLTQFMLAADRENPLVARYYHDEHPCLFKVVEWVCAQARGKPVAICGELAGRPAAVGRLVDAGVRMFSVAPPLVPLVKEEIRRIRATP